MIDPPQHFSNRGDCGKKEAVSLFAKRMPSVRKFATGRIRPSADMVKAMKAKVIVMPKAAVLDPQGNAVRDAMRHLGMPEVRSVRIGKYMEIEIKGQNGELGPRLHRLCRDLLSNPVIEDYELQTAGDRSHKQTPNAQRSTRLRKATARQASNVQLRKAKKKMSNVQRPTSNIERQKGKRKRLR